MQLSQNQKRFVTELFEGLRGSSHAHVSGRQDTPAMDCESGSLSGVLAALSQDQFVKVVQRACRDAENAARTSRVLTIWALRLMPYFERDRTLSVDQAVSAYWRDQEPPASRS
jgi:hypothetical protein